MTCLLSCLKGVSNIKEIDTILSSKNLMVKYYHNDGIYLVRYNKEKSDMKDDDTKMCRGLILNIKDNSLVCLPPSKSMEVNEFLSKVENDWKNVIVEDFVDGTMINVSYNNNTEQWFISTRSCIGGKNRWQSTKNFNDMFQECSCSMDLTKLDKNICYTFVLNHVDNRIVKKYDNNNITLVHAVNVNNSTGLPEILDIYKVNEDLINNGIDVYLPERFAFNTYEDACKNASKLYFENQGYVLKYKNFRSKIRNPSYNWVKNLKGNTNNMKYLYLDLRQNGNLAEYLRCFPEHGDMFSGFQKELHDMTHNLHRAYISLHVKHNANISDIPYQYRKLCYNLHGIYLNSKKPNTFNVVKHFVNKMDVPLQLFTLNYKPN